MIEGSAFLSDMERLTSTVPDLVDDVMTTAATTGYARLMADTSFQNRTYALREAFSQAGDAEGRRLFIDPSATAKRGKTPPAAYGAFLNNGTGRIAARRFMDNAAETIERDIGIIGYDAVSRWAGG